MISTTARKLAISNESEELFMNTYEIYTKLKQAAEVNPEKLIYVWNERCEDWRYYDDMVYTNDIENLKMFLPSEPEEAFAMGRMTGDSYNYSDEWLSLDDYGRPVTCGTYNLTDNFICLEDLARYLEEAKDNDELQELFEELDVADEEYEEE